jgi:hypothetical protein
MGNEDQRHYIVTKSLDSFKKLESVYNSFMKDYFIEGEGPLFVSESGNDPRGVVICPSSRDYKITNVGNKTKDKTLVTKLEDGNWFIPLDNLNIYINHETRL